MSNGERGLSCCKGPRTRSGQLVNTDGVGVMGAAKGAPQLSLDSVWVTAASHTGPGCIVEGTEPSEGKETRYGVKQMTPVPVYVACTLLIGQSLVAWLCLTLLGEGGPLIALTAGLG